MFSRIEPWLRQPTTMLGLAVLFTATGLALCGVISGAAYGCVLPAALGLMGFDDNSMLENDTRVIATHAVTAVVEKQLLERLPELLNDAVKLAADAGAAKQGTPS